MSYSFRDYSEETQNVILMNLRVWKRTFMFILKTCTKEIRKALNHAIRPFTIHNVIETFLIHSHLLHKNKTNIFILCWKRTQFPIIMFENKE